MEIKNSRIIVVLGMHRAGTSSITRGLTVMGVELGQRLLAPVAGNNDKGFWEDIDLYELDVEMLASLGKAWDTLTPVTGLEVDLLNRNGYFLRAVELLRQKVGQLPIFGFKDPRVTKLLPFWKLVFAHCQFQVSYVLVVRHPLSVAKSLSRRDGFDAGRSYFLWLESVVSSLSGVHGERHVLVDYDQSIQSPSAELNRIATALDLTIDPTALKDYQDSFIDETLRHHIFVPGDLALDRACPPLVREVYDALLRVLASRTLLDSSDFQVDLKRWMLELERTQPALMLTDRVEHLLRSANQALLDNNIRVTALTEAETERTEQIRTLAQSVAERDQEILELRQDMSVRNNDMLTLENIVAVRDAVITDLSENMAALATEITLLKRSLEEENKQINLLNAELEDRSLSYQSQIVELEHAVATAQQRNVGHECHVGELERAVGAAEQRKLALSEECASYKSQVALMVQSRSWRLTAPLRQVFAAGKRGKRALLNAAASSYRALRIAPRKKQKMKNGAFRVFGSAFKGVEAYERWKTFQEIQTTWAPTVAAAVVTPAMQMQTPTGPPIINPPLPAANGSWEWQDYPSVKARIAQVKAARREKVSPKPLDMIDIKGKPLLSVAANLRLPELVAKPDVSIIVPVFNNIKLTLECLLSIAQHAEATSTFEVIVADDASTDDTAEVIQSIANIRYTRSETNQGFLRNCNRALSEVNGSYVLYLNNDVQVTAGWLGALLATFDSHEHVGAVGPRFVYPSGHLQEAGAAFMPDGTAAMIGLNEDPAQPRYSYVRRVDYVSGACVLLPTSLAKHIGGFSEEFLPSYCEDSDLCLSVRDAGYDIYYNPVATIIHHLSKTTASVNNDFKMRCIAKNLATLQRKWSEPLDRSMIPRVIAFYLPQYHPVPENDQWWGAGFTDWTNVTKVQPNFVGHHQPRIPADLGYYDLRLIEVMQQQAELAQRYGVHGFCYYYYWFDGKRLLERPVEQLLLSDKPDLPFCLCWANENWTRRWDGHDDEVLMAQSHTVEDDRAVITDLIRYFRDARYIRIDGRPLILIYRVTLFPNFAETAARWRDICREHGIGDIYIAMVESFDLVHSNTQPSTFGCDAAVEFPPQQLAEQKVPTGKILNPNFAGSVADYRDLAVRYATREAPGYTRFKGVMPGWDNSARRQNDSFCFEDATPGAFQAWLEETIEDTRLQNFGDERIVFVNAWNEWAEGAYLEPDCRFGHTYLEAVKNATDASRVRDKNGIGNLK